MYIVVLLFFNTFLIYAQTAFPNNGKVKGSNIKATKQNLPLPIIDMHMHARSATHYGTPPLTMCAPADEMPLWDQRKPIEDGLAGTPCKNMLWSPKTDDELLQQTIAMMNKYNIYGVLGGKPDLVATWMTAAPGRFIPGLDFRLDKGTIAGSKTPATPQEIRNLYHAGAFKILAEVTNQYAGIAPDDERVRPYWILAEELDIPVGIHVGPGGPGEVYLGNSNFRARLQSPLLLEEVLVRHPRLRIYIMHAGYPMLDDLLALLFTYPQVYVEVGIIANVEPRAGFYRYLKAIMDAGYGKRVMFGSDQMIWPGLIEAAIKSIEQAPFLSRQQKRDIFYNNAARFLRLTREEIAAHHLK
ncbi:MAG: amidohydrolase [Flavisolibacter sp.]|nr:amidohydrolase [Flavisolibacter sp.]